MSKQNHASSGKRKVFKSVIETPLAYNWEQAGAGESKQIMQLLDRNFEIVRKHRQQTNTARKLRMTAKLNADNSIASPSTKEKVSAPPPTDIIFGINDIARALKDQKSTIAIIFACRADSLKSSKHMFGHFPVLVHLHPSDIRMVSMPAGTELKVAQKCLFKHPVAFAVTDCDANVELIKFVRSVTNAVHLDYLNMSDPKLTPTTIRQVDVTRNVKVDPS